MRLRSTLSLMLACLLVLTSQVLAQARGQAAVAGEMVICSGGALVTVAVDEEGTPVGVPHVCPDCALSLMDVAQSPPVVVVAPVEQVSALRFAFAVQGAARPVPLASARSPPV